MDKPLDIDQIRIDPSPFQLVEGTSLHKVRLCVCCLFSFSLGRKQWCRNCFWSL